MASYSSSETTLDKGKVTLTGAHETLLINLYARAQDARDSTPILNDQYALETVSRIQDTTGYDFSRTTSRKNQQPTHRRSFATRARIMDICTEQFLEKHPGPATILHLACGMDARSLRVKWQGEGRLWIDADTQEAIQLRTQVMDSPDTTKPVSEYRMVDPVITEEGWMENCGIPADRPLFIIFEGLTPYLTKDQVHGMLRNIVEYCKMQGIHGEIRFDAVGPIMYFLINYVFSEPLMSMGTRFFWYLNNPKALEKDVPGLTYTGRMFKMQDYARFGPPGGVLTRAFLWILDLFNIGGQFGGDYGYSF